MSIVKTTVDSIGVLAEPVLPNVVLTAENLLTFSRSDTWQSCKRKHHYRYREQYAEAVEKTPLVFGHAWHAFQELWWSPRREQVSVEEVLNPYKDKLDAHGWASLLVLARHYTTAHEKESLQYQPLKIEAEFRAPLYDPSVATEPFSVSGSFLLAGKIDGILQDIEKPTTIQTLKENKSTSEKIESDGDPYWNKLTGDHQLSFYTIGADALGFNVQDVLYDVVRKPSIHQKKGETWPDFEKRLNDTVEADLRSYFRWRVIQRQTPELFHAMRDMWDIARLMEIEHAGQLTPRNPAACFQYGTGNRCPYFDTCFLGIPLEENSELMRKAPHQELEVAS